MSPDDRAITLQEVLSGGKTGIARALNLLESRLPQHRKNAGYLLEQLSNKANPRRHIIGITGPPGAGKSSLLSRIIPEYRRRGKSVGIISVDPSSRKSGGALLGDRVRISHDPKDEGVFIRSMAAGSHLGGLAWQTRHCLTVFEAAFETIFIETVGVGQSETEIDQVVDTIVFVVQPGSGDALQFMKAGIMEIPHILLINKGDLKAQARKTLNDLKTASSLNPSGDDDWHLKLMQASAAEGWGQAELCDALEAHREFLLSRCLEAVRNRQRCQWVAVLFRERYGSYAVDLLGGEKRILQIIAETDTRNPFRSFSELERQFHAAHKRHAPAET